MKKFVGIFVFLMIIIGSCICSYAAEEVSIKATTNSSVVGVGEEIKVTLSAMNSGTEEMEQIAGVLAFNENVFELVTMDVDKAIEESEGFMSTVLENMKTQMADEGINWNLLSIKDDYCIIVTEEEGTYAFAGILALSPLKTSTTYTEIGEIAFKVKDSANSTTEKISFTNIQITETIKANDVSTQAITIKMGGSNDYGDIPTFDSEEDDKSSENTPTDVNEEKQESQMANTKAPNTGIEDVIPFIVIALILGVLGYVKYSKYQGI